MIPGLHIEYGGGGEPLTRQRAFKVHGSCLETAAVFSIKDKLVTLPSISRNVGVFDAIFCILLFWSSN